VLRSLPALVMAETTPDTVHPPRFGENAAPPRRPPTYGRLTTAVAVLALAFAGYAVWRLDAMRDRLEQLATATGAHDAERELLRTELKRLDERMQLERRELNTQLAALAEVPNQVQQLANATEELRGRAQGPERAWSRAEAMYLLELAQRRLALNYDVDTAIVALEAADARLAALRDESFASVRQQIARELQSLRALDLPDTTSLTARLASLEDQALALRVKGILAEERTAPVAAELPAAWFPRAWAVLRNAFSDLIRVRDVERGSGGVVTQAEALLRRAHLQLLLFTARSAVTRHDGKTYRAAVASARRWLDEAFDLADPATQAALKELQALEPIEIQPPLPNISGSSATLRRLMPQQSAPSGVDPTRGSN
jgi:uroporphyrin-3 C-methyltransferase